MSLFKTDDIPDTVSTEHVGRSCRLVHDEVSQKKDVAAFLISGSCVVLQSNDELRHQARRCRLQVKELIYPV